MESAIGILQGVIVSGLPLDTINAVANTITAAAVLWAARVLRKSITDIRLLHLQPPLSGLLRLRRDLIDPEWQDDDEERERPR